MLVIVSQFYYSLIFVGKTGVYPSGALNVTPLLAAIILGLK